MQQNRSTLILGVVLILLGVWLVVSRQVPEIQGWLEDINFSWPMWTIAAGLVIFIIGLLTGNPGLSIPAAIVTGTGVILYYQYTMDDYSSWSYMWTLFPGFVGLGTILAGLLGENTRENISRGLNLLFISAILFLIFGTIFGGLAVLGPYGPAILLIGLGVYILIRGFMRNTKKRAQ